MRRVLRVGDRVLYDGAEHQVVAVSGSWVRLTAADRPPSAVLVTHLVASEGFEILGETLQPGPATGPVQTLEDVPPEAAETLLEEIVKLKRARALGLSADLFGGYSDRLVASWRARAMASHPSDFAANQPPVRLTLMATLAWSRTTEITYALVDLFIGQHHSTQAAQDEGGRERIAVGLQLDYGGFGVTRG
jgi:hypothetical protein